MDLAAIDAFLAFHLRKESSAVAILVDVYDTFDRRCEKSGARIVCCTPTLYVWLVSHLFRQEGRPSVRYKVTARVSIKEWKIGTNSRLARRGRPLIGSLARRKEELGFCPRVKDFQMFP